MIEHVLIPSMPLGQCFATIGVDVIDWLSSFPDLSSNDNYEKFAPNVFTPSILSFKAENIWECKNGGVERYFISWDWDVQWIRVSMLRGR